MEGTYGRAAEAQLAMGGGSRQSRLVGLVWAMEEEEDKR